MTFDELGNIAEFISSSAVLISLIYLAFRYFENMFYQNQKGYLEDDVWIGWERLMVTYFWRPGFQSWWLLRREVFSQSFTGFLEASDPTTSIASYHDLIQDGPPAPSSEPV